MNPVLEYWLRLGLRFLLAGTMVAMGILHLRVPSPFIQIVPKFLPAPALLVLVSGIFEIVGGIGLLIPQTRLAAGYGLMALFICVVPANINMAVNSVPVNGIHFPAWQLWLRLPLQLLLIGWAWWVSKAPA